MAPVFEPSRAGRGGQGCLLFTYLCAPGCEREEVGRFTELARMCWAKQCCSL